VRAVDPVMNTAKVVAAYSRPQDAIAAEQGR
jgi:hypothetical protein